MICPVIPVGDGIIVMLSKNEAEVIVGETSLAVEVADFGMVVTFEAEGGAYELQLSYEAGKILSETEGNIYFYGAVDDSDVSVFFRMITVDVKLLNRVVGAWDALYGGVSEAV